MLKRLAPPLAVLISVLLDTAVIPAFYYGRFLIPLSLIVVILIGIQLGRTQGMLWGMVAGLLLDISAGSLGLKLIPFILIGFLIGFLLDQQPEISRNMERIDRLHLLAIRMIWVSALVLLYEVVMMIFQYFSTAIFTWVYVGNLLLRTVAITVLVQLFYPLFRRIWIGKDQPTGKKHSTREVKTF